MLQAYIHGEAVGSEQVILEQHLAECSKCSELLRQEQWLSAQLFEAFAEDRLTRPLRRPVLEHLPEMEPSTDDLAGLNWRAKHPSRRWTVMSRVLAVAAALLLCMLTLVLSYNWPTAPRDGEMIGVVAQSRGRATCVLPESTQREAAAPSQYIHPGTLYETDPAGALMLSLAGPTRVKLAGNTRVRVTDARRLQVERGQVWLDVACDGRLFRVTTPSGDITVFGTVLGVEVGQARTTVTVARGEVTVERGHRFKVVSHGQQVRVPQTGELAEPRAVDTAPVLAWAEHITPDPSADSLFAKSILAKSENLELAAESSFIITMPPGDLPRSIEAIRLYWDSSKPLAGKGGYDLYVSDGGMRPLFKTRVEGTVFEDPLRECFEIVVPGRPLREVRALVLRLVPVPGTEPAEIPGLQVKAVLGSTES